MLQGEYRCLHGSGADSGKIGRTLRPTSAIRFLDSVVTRPHHLKLNAASSAPVKGCQLIAAVTRLQCQPRDKRTCFR